MLRSLVLSLAAALLALTAACGSAPPRAPQAPVRHQGAGTVVEVDLGKSRVKINHEEMEGYMKPMTMWFPVKEAKLIEGLRPNDRVAFTVAEEESSDVIVEIRKI